MENECVDTKSVVVKEIGRKWREAMFFFEMKIEN